MILFLLFSILNSETRSLEFHKALNRDGNWQVILGVQWLDGDSVHTVVDSAINHYGWAFVPVLVLDTDRVHL